MFSSSKVFSAFAAVLAAGSLAVLPGCDWFKGSGPGVNLSPFLSSLSVSPSSVLYDQKFSVSFRYDDPQGDIARTRVTFKLNGGSEARDEAPLWPDNISRSSGTVTFPFTFVSPDKGGTWTVKVQVFDDQEHASNTLSGEIILNAPD